METRVRLIGRVDANIFPGGDLVQFNAIAEYLSNLGYTVSKSFDLIPKCEDIDVGIIFNLTRPFETYVQSKILKEKNIPFIFFQFSGIWTKRLVILHVIFLQLFHWFRRRLNIF